MSPTANVDHSHHLPLLMHAVENAGESYRELEASPPGRQFSRLFSVLTHSRQFSLLCAMPLYSAPPWIGPPGQNVKS